MNSTEFGKILSARLVTTEKTLQRKREEYANGFDVLHNFKQAAAFLQCTPDEAAWAFATKHLVSIADMVGHSNPIAAWEEKLGDAINYLILIEAIVKEAAGGAGLREGE